MSRYTGPVTRLATAAKRRRGLARLALLWEDMWPAIWPAAFVAGAFVAVSLFDAWRLIPGWLHGVVLALFAVGVGGLLLRGLHGLRLPGVDRADRRIERASGLAHRPLVTLTDRPAGSTGDALTRGLWRAHVERTARAAGPLRIGAASPGLARRDPLGLRAALLLMLVIAGVAAGGDAPGRMARAFAPDFSGLGPGGPADLTLWITPPAYTGAAPLFLAAGPGAGATVQPAILTVPMGSAVLARVHAGRGGVPELVTGVQSVAFDAVDAANYVLHATLTQGDRLAVVQDGDEVGAWPLTVLVDQPPRIEFAKPPGRTQRSSLRLDYLAEDDYGLAAIEATLRLVDHPEQSMVLELPLPRPGARTAEDSSFHDLTPHLWAGLAVTIRFGATDAIGQVGHSEAVETVLPERIFNHPIARALIEQRKVLTIDPSMRGDVAREIHRLSLNPAQFFEDIGVFLGMRAANARLRYDPSDRAIAEVQDLLWDLALTIEDGPVALAERELRDAQKDLLDALSRGAEDEEIERLIEELLARLDEYLDALVEQAMNQRDRDPGLEDQLQQAIERGDLRDMIERARELFRTGAPEAARELLAQLQELLENLRAGRFADSDQQGPQKGQQSLEDLERLMQDQQKLLDETFRWSQGNGKQGQSKSGGGKPGGGGSPSMGGAPMQEALRQRLGELMLDWSETGLEIPRPLGRAERAMREAGRALSRSQPGLAVPAQTDAMDQMEQAAQAMLDAMLSEMGRGSRRPGGNLGLFGQRDPLGRGVLGRGLEDDGRTRVPDEADLQRSREILRELYRRASEYSRPDVERDYINRLLRRF